MQRLLVSVRGPKEAIEAARGGAAVADVEYPASALGTPYPLNVDAVSRRLKASGYARVKISTNIGEQPFTRATTCQAALGVALAGADLVKFGLAEQPLEAASYLGKSVVRTLRRWFPNKLLFPAVFVDDDLRRYCDPVSEGARLVAATGADGLLVDTYNKSIGKGLLDYIALAEIRKLARTLHRSGHECWVAGSIGLEDLPGLWATGVDVVCVRGAACKPGSRLGRFGDVDAEIVRRLVATIPRRRSR